MFRAVFPWLGVLGALIILAAVSCRLAKAQETNQKWIKQLGYELFFDKRLSVDGATSCSSCHHPDKGWSDGRALAIGMIVNGRGSQGTFNSPTILNARFKLPQFWDGRANGLSDQALQPLTNPIEMGNATLDQVTDRLEQIPRYRRLFAAAFGSYGVTSTRMAFAIASFEADINSTDAPIDRYLAGDKTALSKNQKRGWQLIKAFGCTSCHNPDNDFRDGLPHNTGVAARTIGDNEQGFRNRRMFITPTWRELARTAPYFHNGAAKDIRSVIVHYMNATRFIQNGRETVDPLIDPMVNLKFKINENDLKSMEDFLLNATAGKYPYVVDPFSPRRKENDSSGDTTDDVANATGN